MIRRIPRTEVEIAIVIAATAATLRVRVKYIVDIYVQAHIRIEHEPRAATIAAAPSPVLVRLAKVPGAPASVPDLVEVLLIKDLSKGETRGRD